MESESSSTFPSMLPARRSTTAATATGICSQNVSSVSRQLGSVNWKNAERDRQEMIMTLRDSVVQDMSNMKEECRTEMWEEVQKLTNKLEDANDIIRRNEAELERTKRTQTANLQALVAACKADLQQEINTVTCSVNDLAWRCNGEQLDRKTARDQDLERLASLEGKLNETRAELSASTAVRWRAVMAMILEQHEMLTSSMSTLEDKLSFHFEEVRGSASEGLSCAAALQAQHDNFFSKFEQTEEEFRARINVLENRLKHHVQQAKEEGAMVLNTTETQLAELRTETERRLLNLDHQTTHLQCAVNEVENFATRRVEWVIRDFVSQLERARGTNHWRWLSPEFAAAGVQNLQLELKLPVDANIEDEDSIIDTQCAICLWASHGFYLVCKIYVGNVSLQFNHHFDGQSPYSIERMCSVRDQVCQEDDTLRICLEILEAVRELEHPPKPLPVEQGLGVNNVAGTIVTHRYLNHRMLDLVQSQVELMHSRMVRRIEWCIENASMLQRCFPEGESMCSKSFEAAGVGGLQLVFYPCGYKGARPGYCSYFLQCPANSALRCWLSAGKQRREAHLAFDRPGVMGRINFCHFENCVDTADDSVPLVLEIEEAQHNITEIMQHQPKATTSAVEVPNCMTRQLSPAKYTENSPSVIRSSVKLQRASANATLEDVRQLPSIWTSRPEVNVSEAMEGFQPFSTLKTIKKPTTPRRPPSSGQSSRRRFVSCNSIMTTTDKSPTNGKQSSSKYMMYAM